MIYQNSFQNWIFDLDNTLYDINLGLFKKISNRITDFIMSKYSLDIDQAKKIQKEYYLKYGLTLRGLIVEKKLEPEEFLDYVHDVEHPELKKNDQLISKIRILEGKKIIFTNATSKHAKKILKILELEHDFDQIIDIKDLEYIPKPDKRSYKKLLECLNLNKENLNKTIFVEDTVKNLPDYEGRALLYQRFLLTDNLENKLSLLSKLNNSFENSNFKKSFDDELSKLLKKMDKKEIPLKFSDFYQTNLITEEKRKNKIKFNNEVFHQSKVLNYFLNKQSLPKTQKLTDNLLSKMKKDKNYSFNFKDVVLIQSLRSDGIQIDQIDELSQYKSELNSEIDKMIENKESGMILLKLVEIIGEKELNELNSESLNFIVEVMNRTKLISLRNELLLEILPLKV